MIGYGTKNKNISVGYLPNRKKPCLVLKQENMIYKVATFNDAYSARLFFDYLADLMYLERIDWKGDDVPVGLNPDWREDESPSSL